MVYVMYGTPSLSALFEELLLVNLLGTSFYIINSVLILFMANNFFIVS